MTAEQLRGRKIVVSIAALLLAPAVVRLGYLIGAGLPAASGWLSLIWNLSISWCLYKAYRWARGYATLSLMLSAVPPGVQLLVGVPFGLMRGLFGPAALTVLTDTFLLTLNLGSLWLLWRSTSVTAYFDHEASPIAALHLSGGTSDAA